MGNYLVLTDSGVLLISPEHYGNCVVSLPSLYTMLGAYPNGRFQETL